MTVSEGHAVHLDDNLSRSPDRQVGVRWPVSVDDRLDRLVRSAENAGERTNRRELLAALVATCEREGDALGEVLRRYRTMRVRDALPAQPPGTTVVHLADHRPGPRTGGTIG